MTRNLISAARAEMSNASMRTSAESCLEDALSLLAKGDYVHAAERAVCSLEYSVGVFKIGKTIEQCGMCWA
jgi:hypothetical protein